MDVKKHVHGVFRAGVNYDNKASVQEKRENGELPAENAGLPWGEWLKPPYLVSHKGNIYVRLYPTPNCKVESYFTIDGEKVSDEEIFGRYVISRYEGDKLVVINDNARIYETKGENLLVTEVKPAIVTAAEYPRDETPECITVRLDHIVC
ncbi:hypothetical protein D6827_02940 [Candidatus Parcubacteria bacterium]|nr:MAG: hypothetical protein D6827_02940 [Candidatus Parcubacteria bacterium]